MKDQGSKYRDQDAGRATCRPVPEFITCPGCGFDMDLWTEEDDETRCIFCGHRFFRREMTLH